MKRVLLLIGLFLLPCWDCFAQETSDIEKLLEENGILDSEENYEEMLTTLFYLRQHPLDINTVGFDSLKMLFFLSDSQIDQILIFRNKIGAFKHPNELLLITGIGKRDLTNILPFIRIGTSATTPAFKKKTRVKQELLARLKTTYPTQTGYRKYTREAFLKEKDLKKNSGKTIPGATVRNPVKIQNRKPFPLGRRSYARERPGRKLLHEISKKRFRLFIRTFDVNQQTLASKNHYRGLQITMGTRSGRLARILRRKVRSLSEQRKIRKRYRPLYLYR